ncbi:MAG: ArsR family transcriptional regulator, partial [Synergistaceae bacterium]|nr:ArsR family transcriptional regulator [Synergistaceae bacterium]
MEDQRLTQEHIRDNNRNMIYMYIYRGQKVFQQNIVSDLNMSRPTVINHLSAMRKEGLIFRSRLVPSAEANPPGRTPVTWSVNACYKIALGVEILKESVKIIAVDLYGHALRWEKL